MANLINFVNSIVQNGGASYNLITGEFNPDNGFMVSAKGKEFKREYNGSFKSIQYDVASYIKENAHIIMAGVCDTNTFIGAWVDNGELYLDISSKVDNEADAHKLAVQNEQKAYFDNKNKQSIFIDNQ